MKFVYFQLSVPSTGSIHEVLPVLLAPDIHYTLLRGTNLYSHYVEPFNFGIALEVLSLSLLLLVPAELPLLLITPDHQGHKRNYYFLPQIDSRVELFNHLFNFLNIAGLVATGQVGAFGQDTSVVLVAVEEDKASAVVEHAAQILHELPLQSLPNRPLRKHPQGHLIVLVDHASIHHEVLGTPQALGVGVKRHADPIHYLLHSLPCEAVLADIEGGDVEDVLPVEEPFLEADDFPDELPEFLLLEALNLDVEVALALVERVDLCEVVHHQLVQHVLLVPFLAQLLPQVIQHLVQDLIVLLKSILQPFLLSPEFKRPPVVGVLRYFLQQLPSLLLLSGLRVLLIFFILVLHLRLYGPDFQQQSELLDEVLHLGI